MDYPLQKYFDALDSGDTSTIPDMFSVDATYIRPSAPSPDSPQLGRIELMRGRAAIKEYFDRRGILALRHFVRAAATEGSHCFCDGVVKVPDVPGVTDMVFMCHAVFNDDGLIAWYAGFVDVVSSEEVELIDKTRMVY